MGQYNKAFITTAGESLIARAIVGAIQLEITKAKTSDHKYPGDTNFKALIDLQGIKQIMGSPETRVLEHDLIQTRTLFSNEEIQDTYYIQNIGLYAMDGAQEVLFCIVTAETPDEMPMYNGVAATSYIYNIQNVVQDAAEIHVTVNPSGTATIQDVLERVDATGGDISETAIDTLETTEGKFPIPVAGERVKTFLGKVLTFLRNVKPLDSNVQLFVATIGSDITGDGTQNKPFKTISYALSRIPRDLNNYFAGLVIESGEYNENLDIGGFHSGQLFIVGKAGGGVSINGTKINTVSDCTARVVIRDMAFFCGLISGGYDVVSVYNCKALTIENCSIDGNSQECNGVRIHSSNVELSGITYNNCNICWYVGGGDNDMTNSVNTPSLVSVSRAYGTGNFKYYECRNGQTVFKDNSVPGVADSIGSRDHGGVVVSHYGANIGTLNGAINLYVATTGNNSISDGSQAKPFKTIQRAINSLPKDLGGFNASIYISEGTYNESVEIVGYHNGHLMLLSDSADTLAGTCKLSAISVRYCSAYVSLNGFNCTITTDFAFKIWGCQHVLIQSSQVTTPSADSAAGIYFGESLGRVIACRVANRYAALRSLNSKVISSGWDTPNSMNNNYGLLTNNGGVIHKYGSQPRGVLDEYNLTGGVIINENGTQISHLITSGMSCTWGTISGGYVRYGNIHGVAMVTIQLSVITNTTLNAGVQYGISGLPVPIMANVNTVAIATNRQTAASYLSTNGGVQFIPSQTLASNNQIIFNATYMTNSNS